MIGLVTFQGLYRYNPEIFNGITPYLPEGVDASEMQSAILRKVADLPALYVDPFFLQEYIANWAATRELTWEKVQDALTANYSPIENYNMNEDETEHLDRSGESSGTDKEFVQAFETSKGLTNSGKMEHTENGSSGEERGRELHRHGNIGVTSNVTLILQELALRAENNIYEFIANDFKNEFCVLIY